MLLKCTGRALYLQLFFFFFVEVEQVTTKTQKQSVKAKNTEFCCATLTQSNQFDCMQ